MKTTQSALLVIVTISAIANQNAFAQTKPAPTPSTAATPQRPELTPGPRPLSKREQGMLRDARIAYVAQAKNDIQTFLHYVADEFFTFDSETGKVSTKDTWRQ